MNVHDDSKSESDKPVQPPDSGSTREDLTNPTLGLDAAGSAETSDLSGVTVGDYEILHLIGAGGGGQVYQARHRHMGRIVAIKVLAISENSDAATVLRFRREVRASAKLMHPNVVTAFDAGEYGGLPYLVMEFVDGVSLYQLVQQDGPLSVQRASGLVMQAATGLAYAHGEGIIHRDIKPSNLMLDQNSNVKILDLGLARLSGVEKSDMNELMSSELTSHGTVIGTAGYISPEQISSSRRVDHRTDIYSLGCTFYFLLTGQPPYIGSIMETLVAHARDPVPNLIKARPDIPTSLSKVFDQMMAKNVADRLGSMEEVISALERFADGSTSTQMAIPTLAMTNVHASLTPGKSDEGTSTISSRRAVGFDIGTHTSHAAWIGEDGFPHIIPHQGAVATPSVVRFQSGEFAIGKAALESIVTDADNIVDRFVGHLGQDDSSTLLDGKEFPAEVLTAVLARQIADSAQQDVGYFSPVTYTVPGCFGDVQRRAYADAFQIAYLETFVPMNAATAVVTHYSFMNGWLNPKRKTEDRTLLVLRFGGGSFDATVFHIANRHIATVAIVGDMGVSGSSWDDSIVACVADQLDAQHGIDIRSDRAKLLMLRRHCESGKVALTTRDQFPFRVQIKGKSLGGVLSRAFVNKLGVDLIERAHAVTVETLAVAGVSWHDLHHILLAGGTSRMPMVRESVKRWSGQPAVTSVMQTDAAPSGAALSSQMQMQGALESLDFQTQEVTSHYFGIRGFDRHTGEERTSIIVPRNTELPATGTGVFRTSKEGQTSIVLKIVEGTDNEGTESRLIGSCHIVNLPPGQPAGTQIEIELHVAESGTVSVSVESVATGRRSAPEIERTGSLSVQERNRWRDWLYTGCITSEFG